MPKNKKASQTKRARETKISKTTESSKNISNNNDETNENESLNQEESSIINNETSIPAPPNPSSVNQQHEEVMIVNSMPLINHLRMHQLIMKKRIIIWILMKIKN